MTGMLEIENNLTDTNLVRISKSDKNPIAVFKYLVEKPEKNFTTGFGRIIDGPDFRIIKGFRVLHNSVLYGPLDVLDLDKLTSSEDNSVYAHGALEQLKQKGIVDFRIEIPAEYNIAGRLWRKYYYGQELSTLKLATEDMQRYILEECIKTTEQMKTLNAPKRLLPNEGKIKRKLEKLSKRFGSEKTKIPLYENRIKKVLEELASNYGLINMDYHGRNVIINPKTEKIAIIDGYWKVVGNFCSEP